MNYYVLTLFPDMIRQITETSILGRAVRSGAIHVETVNIRDFSTRSSMRIDDYPYGGGAGIVMEPEPVYQAVRSVEDRLGHRPRVIYLTPQAKVLDQTMVEELAQEEELILLCGHYEGIDERVLEEVVTDYVSIGDYVLTGGELGAAVIIDAVSRFIPGVLNNDESAQFDSFQDNLLEYPHYTRPEEWHGRRVPEVLLSGDHGKIEAWRHEQSLLRTRERRPELLEKSFRITGIWYGTETARETAQSLAARLSRYGTVLDYGRKKLQKMHRSFQPQDLVLFVLPEEPQEMALSERFRNLRGEHTPAILLADDPQQEACRELAKLLWEQGFSVIGQETREDAYRTPEGCVELALEIRKKVLQ